MAEPACAARGQGHVHQSDGPQRVGSEAAALLCMHPLSAAAVSLALTFVPCHPVVATLLPPKRRCYLMLKGLTPSCPPLTPPAPASCLAYGDMCRSLPRELLSGNAWSSVPRRRSTASGTRSMR